MIGGQRIGEVHGLWRTTAGFSESGSEKVSGKIGCHVSARIVVGQPFETSVLEPVAQVGGARCRKVSAGPLSTEERCGTIGQLPYPVQLLLECQPLPARQTQFNSPDLFAGVLHYSLPNYRAIVPAQTATQFRHLTDDIFHTHIVAQPLEPRSKLSRKVFGDIPPQSEDNHPVPGLGNAVPFGTHDEILGHRPFTGKEITRGGRKGEKAIAARTRSPTQVLQHFEENLVPP